MLRTDEVDERIIGLLREDGRLSNREVARRLSISEGTVRQRLKKLDDAGVIRIGAVVDPAKTGMGLVATVMLAVEPSQVEATLAVLSALPETLCVASMMGAYNIYVSLAARDLASVRDLVTSHIERREGVLRIDVRLMVRTPKHEVHMVVIRPGSA